MSTTLSNGYKKPLTGERGSWWKDLEDNIQRVNDHTHDGLNSNVLASTSISKGTTSILAANWIAVGAGKAGLYYQDITVPTNYDTSTAYIKFYLNNGANIGTEIMPSTKVLTSTTYRIFCNDNTVAIKAVYA